MAVREQQSSIRDQLDGVAGALSTAGVLALIVDSAGDVTQVAGGFAPRAIGPGALTDVLGADILDSDLIPALVDAITTRSGTDADFSLAGIPCHALCCPINGTTNQGLILITPDYRAHGQQAEAHQAPRAGCDVRELMLEVRRRMEQSADRGNEVFAWTEDKPLEVATEAATVRRLLDVLLEAPLATQRFDGTAVLTARRDHARDDAVVLRMRVYGAPVRDSILRALESIYAEFSAVSGIPIEMSESESTLDITATLNVDAQRVAADRTTTVEAVSRASAS